MQYFSKYENVSSTLPYHFYKQQYKTMLTLHHDQGFLQVLVDFQIYCSVHIKISTYYNKLTWLLSHIIIATKLQPDFHNNVTLVKQLYESVLNLFTGKICTKNLGPSYKHNIIKVKTVFES